MLPLEVFLIPSFLFSLFRPVYASEQNGDANLGSIHSPVQDVLEHKPSTYAGCQHIPSGPIEATKCDYETIESVNELLYKHLHALVGTPFFRYYRVDLYRECPFWQENGFCMNRECAITTVDESAVPEHWRAAALSKLEMPDTELRNTLPGCYYRDTDFCFIDDMSEGDYVDLQMNPERFTGYAGPSAHRVWKSIYEENCFGIDEKAFLNGLSSNSGSYSPPDVQSKPKSSLFTSSPSSSSKDDQLCLEKRVYYKIISGLHASITTHICHDDFNQTSGEWVRNLPCFINRVASHPERLQHIYFNTVLLMRAVARVGKYLSSYDYCSSGTHEEHASTLKSIGAVVGMANVVGKFDEREMFKGDDADVLKEEFKAHFRNVTRIMDCVGCDKCRLWGKIQTTGLGTALKVLFELDESSLDPRTNPNLLSRSEVVALINTFHRFSESLKYVNEFRQMWTEVGREESRRLIAEAERVVGKEEELEREDPDLQIPGKVFDEPAGTPSGSMGERINKGLNFFMNFSRVSVAKCVNAFGYLVDAVPRRRNGNGNGNGGEGKWDKTKGPQRSDLDL